MDAYLVPRRISKIVCSQRHGIINSGTVADFELFIEMTRTAFVVLTPDVSKHESAIVILIFTLARKSKSAIYVLSCVVIVWKFL